MRNHHRILALAVFSFVLLLGLEGTAHAQTGDRGLTDGFWGTRAGCEVTMYLAFHDNGRCVLAFAKRGNVVKKLVGRYHVRGNRIFMRMTNGKRFRLRFAIRGNRLLIRDGTDRWSLVRLRR